MDYDPEEISPELAAEIDELLKNPPGEEEQKKLDAMERRAARVKTFGKNKGQPKEDRTVTVSMRVNSTLNEQLRYWSDKRELTLSEYMIDAVREKIARENGDYDLPTLEIGRLAQIVDELRTQSVTINNLEKTISSMLQSIIMLSRDPKYMIESVRSVENG